MTANTIALERAHNALRVFEFCAEAGYPCESVDILVDALRFLVRAVEA